MTDQAMFHPDCRACCAIGRCHWCPAVAPGTYHIALAGEARGGHVYVACVHHAQLLQAAIHQEQTGARGHDGVQHIGVGKYQVIEGVPLALSIT
jgi:hypothetical protein